MSASASWTSSAFEVELCLARSGHRRRRRSMTWPNSWAIASLKARSGRPARDAGSPRDRAVADPDVEAAAGHVRAAGGVAHHDPRGHPVRRRAARRPLAAPAADDTDLARRAGGVGGDRVHVGAVLRERGRGPPERAASCCAGGCCRSFSARRSGLRRSRAWLPCRWRPRDPAARLARAGVSAAAPPRERWRRARRVPGRGGRRRRASARHLARSGVDDDAESWRGVVASRGGRLELHHPDGLARRQRSGSAGLPA